MSRGMIQMSGAILLWGSLMAATPSLADDRTAAAILEEIDAIKLPEADLTREGDKEYLRQFRKQRGELRVRRADLIGELYRVAPDNPRLVFLLPVRWRSFSGRLVGPDDNAGVRDLTGELNEVLTHYKSAELKTEAAFIKAWIAGDPYGRMGSAKGYAAQAKAVEDFIAFAPKDERGAELLYYFTFAYRDDQALLEALYARIVKEYPESEQGKVVRRILNRLASVGKTFDLTFNDAISSTEISMRSLRGKIIVVDFWATWCGPCVAEMPRMKELYAKYHDKGVEFIGISLDQSKEDGGFDKLKAFVAKNDIPWPQYYQGNHWQSEFSKSWGVNSIPAVFLVDREGKLFSTDAGGNLESLIRELMDRKALNDGSVRGH
jgi:thiol-disulfide isomerase/thioredoxin